MKKFLSALILAGCLYFTNSSTALASDYWVYSSGGCNYYAVSESLRLVKGAYDIDVKEVSPNGKVFRYGLEFYNDGKGIVWQRTPVRAHDWRRSNGQDIIAALYKYVTTISK